MSDSRDSLPVLAGRYALVDTLGEGSFGRVYRAFDRATKRDVAVKHLHAANAQHVEGLRAEAALLRYLRLPGVVEILDEGTHEGRPYFVTEFVEGHPFPGPKRPVEWDALRPTATLLFLALERVHATGVVHRDIKPENVLVRSDGQPVLLDFGVADVSNARWSDPDMMLGTPAYIAPEQVLGRTDVRSDLYSIGVMLFEALSGRLPHESESVNALLHARCATPAPDLASVAPGVPTEVASLVNALLETDASARPSSAAEVLARLGASSGTRSLPRVGGEHPVRAVVARLLDRKLVRITGPSGSGRSRVLQDAAERLRRRGIKVAWTRAARGAYESLPAAFRTAQVERLLCRFLDTGGVLLVDDAEDVDPHTARLVESLCGGGVAWVERDASRADVWMRTLEPHELRSLFAGSDLLHHEREDAALLLHEATGGLARDVSTTLDTWVRDGHGYWVGGRVRMRRASLDVLRSRRFVPDRGEPLRLETADFAVVVESLREVDEISDTLDGVAIDPQRTLDWGDARWERTDTALHDAHAGLVSDADVSAALEQVSDALQRGDVVLAYAASFHGFRRALRTGDAAALRAALERFADVAFAADSVPWMEHALHLAHRIPETAAQHLRRLLSAALTSRKRGNIETAWAACERVPEQLHLPLEVARWQIRVRVAARRSASAVLEQARMAESALRSRWPSRLEKRCIAARIAAFFAEAHEAAEDFCAAERSWEVAAGACLRRLCRVRASARLASIRWSLGERAGAYRATAAARAELGHARSPAVEADVLFAERLLALRESTTWSRAVVEASHQLDDPERKGRLLSVEAALARRAKDPVHERLEFEARVALADAPRSVLNELHQALIGLPLISSDALSPVGSPAAARTTESAIPVKERSTEK